MNIELVLETFFWRAAPKMTLLLSPALRAVIGTSSPRDICHILTRPSSPGSAVCCVVLLGNKNNQIIPIRLLRKKNELAKWSFVDVTSERLSSSCRNAFPGNKQYVVSESYLFNRHRLFSSR